MAPQDDRVGMTLTGSARSLALAVACLGFFVVILDATVVNVALPAMGRALGGGTSGLQWVVDAYTLVLAALLLTAGVLGDRLGARRVFAAGLLVFTVASALCAAAPGMGALIAARVLQGAGAALALPTSLSLIAHAFPDGGQRARAIGLWVGCGGVAVAAGPPLGGLLVEGLGWRAVFLVNVPIGLAGSAVALRWVPSPPRAAGRSVDVPGQVLAIASLFALTFGVIEAGSQGWSSPLVAGSLAAAGLGAAAFLGVERRVADPMLPLPVLTAPGVMASTAVGVLVNLSFYGQVFVFSLYFQDVRGESALVAGAAFLPLTAAIPFVSALSGRVTARLGPLVPLAVGLVFGVVGFLGMVAAGESPPYVLLVPGFLLTSLASMVPAPLTAVAVGAVPVDRSGLASGILNAGRQVGGALGVAIFGTLVGGADRFADGMRLSLLAAAGALALGLLIVLAGVPRSRREEARITLRRRPSAGSPPKPRSAPPRTARTAS
jgi:DHA2 family methylenomycin A resistance protein-like MFS transporter